MLKAELVIQGYRLPGLRLGPGNLQGLDPAAFLRAVRRCKREQLCHEHFISFQTAVQLLLQS